MSEVMSALTLSANFVALYAVCPGRGTKPDKDDTMRMCPFLQALHSSMHVLRFRRAFGVGIAVDAKLRIPRLLQGNFQGPSLALLCH